VDTKNGVKDPAKRSLDGAPFRGRIDTVVGRPSVCSCLLGDFILGYIQGFSMLPLALVGSS
jgi:hypothetical protein